LPDGIRVLRGVRHDLAGVAAEEGVVVASRAVFDRSGAMRMSVTSSIRSVTAPAAARAINGS